MCVLQWKDQKYCQKGPPDNQKGEKEKYIVQQ